MIFYRIYQICIMAPILVVWTALIALMTAVGCLIGNQRFWGYYPAHVWARLFCILSFVRVTVKGRENIKSETSYVFVANHQGAYDIFAAYGYLNHNFRWMMKKGLERIPLVGFACHKAGQIFVDNSSPSAVRRTMSDAERQLSGGMSVMVFPEGSRTLDGKVHAFRRGAYSLAMEFSLPVIPVTIDGAYKVMRRGTWLPRPGHIILTIHKPITADASGHDLQHLMEQSRADILSALPNKE